MRVQPQSALVVVLAWKPEVHSCANLIWGQTCLPALKQQALYQRGYIIHLLHLLSIMYTLSQRIYAAGSACAIDETLRAEQAVRCTRMQHSRRALTFFWQSAFVGLQSLYLIAYPNSTRVNCWSFLDDIQKAYSCPQFAVRPSRLSSDLRSDLKHRR